MRTKTIRHPILLAILCLSVAGFTGCTSTSTVPGFNNTPTLTPAQAAIKQQNSIKLGAALATKGALIGLDSAEAKSVAMIANTTAIAILTATANNTIDITTMRQLALTEIQKSGGTAKQKVIVSQVVDALGLIVQDYIDNNLATMSTPDKLTATIGAIRAAAAGVCDGTVLFLN